MVPPFNLVSNVKSIIKLLSILAILVASMFSVSSCTEDWEDAYLAIDQNNFSIPSSGETKTISIQTNSDWRVVTKNASSALFHQTPSVYHCIIDGSLIGHKRHICNNKCIFYPLVTAAV